MEFFVRARLRLPQCILLLCQTAPCRAKQGSQPDVLFLATEVSLTEVLLHSSTF